MTGSAILIGHLPCRKKPKALQCAASSYRSTHAYGPCGSASCPGEVATDNMKAAISETFLKQFFPFRFVIGTNPAYFVRDIRKGISESVENNGKTRLDYGDGTVRIVSRKCLPSHYNGQR